MTRQGPMPELFRRLALASSVAILAAAAAPPLPRAAAASAVTQGGVVSVDVDKAVTIPAPEVAVTVFVTNSDIADVRADNPRQVVVFGRKLGSTTLYVTDKAGRVSSYTVHVVRPVGEAQDAVAAQAPGAPVTVSGGPNGLTVSGEVETPRQAAAVKGAARQFVGDKEDLNFDVGVVESTQVNLQVRVAEVSRQVSRSFGFNWSAVTNNGSTATGLLIGRSPLTGDFGSFSRDTSIDQLSSIGLGYRSPGGSANISMLIDALRVEGLVTVLAEPNLTATSGETANFLAGGEFPVPVALNQNQITIEWKKFGVSLDFTPTVLDGGRISVKVRPEVSELSDKGAVTINSIKVPGVSVRRAETTVELGSGQSFAIAGLFLNNGSSSTRNLPGLGDLPVLGPLFRSSDFTRDESELVIIVTPYIVRPTARTSDLKTPVDGLTFANGLEQILYGKLDGADAASRPHLAGPAGFMLEEKR